MSRPGGPRACALPHVCWFPKFADFRSAKTRPPIRAHEEGFAFEDPRPALQGDLVRDHLRFIGSFVAILSMGLFVAHNSPHGAQQQRSSLFLGCGAAFQMLCFRRWDLLNHLLLRPQCDRRRYGVPHTRNGGGSLDTGLGKEMDVSICPESP